MSLTGLKINFFRNFDQVSIEGFQKTNLIIGPNGSGKTNLIEALSMLSTTRPLRKVYDRDLVHWTASYFYLKGEYSDLDVELSFDGKQKGLKVNGEVFPLSRLEGKNPSVAFLASDLYLLTGAPSLRRGFLNTALSKISPDYRQNLLFYNRILRQRNMQFKRDAARVSIWNTELVRLGSLLTLKRRQLCDFLSKELNFLFERLYGISIRLKYNSSFGEDIQKDFYRLLEREKKREFYAKHTLVGPHRDDFEITAEDRKLNLFASQGQVRSLVIALKLSVAKLIEKSFQILPLLLVDDALLELDEKRRRLLIGNFFDRYQTVITLTSEKFLSDFPKDFCLFRIKEGKIEKQSSSFSSDFT